MKDRYFYLLNVLRKRLDYPALKRAVQELARAFGAQVILIEDKASGTHLIQELVQEGLHTVTRYLPDCDRMMRLHAQTGAIENGFVHLPKEAYWLAEYLQELTTFPASKYDDQVDSTSQFLDWSKRRPAGWGWVEYYRQLAEGRLRDNVQPLVKLKAPSASGVTHVITLTGRTVAVALDRMIDVTEDEARPLRAGGFADR